MINNDIISGLWFWGFEALLFCVWWALIRYATKRVTKGITISDDQEK